MTIKKFFDLLTEKIFEKRPVRRCYIPYMDSDGNKLSEEEILFMDETNYQKINGGENLGDLQVYTVFSPGVEAIYDDAGNFPIALISPDTELMYIKVSKKTGEILPIHAGCCSSIDVIYTGAPNAGKTIHILQMSDVSFHDTLVKNTNCCFEDDLPNSSPHRKRYEEAGKQLKKHIVPEPTRRGEIILPYVYYITYMKNEEECKHILLRLQDIDGQECVDMAWNSKILPYNYFFYFVSAEELIAGELGQPVQYTKVLDHMIPKLRVLRREKNYEIMVIISQCDRLKKDHPCIKDAFQNSIEKVEGFERLRKHTHDKGFDFTAFQHRADCVEMYLKEECPNFYRKLVHAFPKQKLSFCMIASIGSICEGNTFNEYLPFCIDEPILSVLAQKGMYPIAKTERKIQEEKVENFSINDIRKKIGNFFEELQIDD